MGIWRQMLCVSGSRKIQEILKRCCRNEEVLQLDDEFPVRLITALERQKTLGHGDVGDQVIWSNLLPTFLCWRTLSRTGKTKLKFLCKMWTPHRNSNTVISVFNCGYPEHWTGRWGPMASFLVRLCQRCCIWVHAILDMCYLRLTPEIQRCDNDWTPVVPLRRNVVSKTHINSFYTFIITEEWNLRPLPTRGPAVECPSSQKHNDKFHINDDLPLDALNMRTTHASPVIHIV
jgi:hypothetical protein